MGNIELIPAGLIISVLFAGLADAQGMGSSKATQNGWALPAYSDEKLANALYMRMGIVNGRSSFQLYYYNGLILSQTLITAGFVSAA